MKICASCKLNLDITNFYKYRNKNYYSFCKKCYNKKKNDNRRIGTDKELVKKKISESVKKYWNENPDKHPWKKSEKFLSKPCENFKKILDKKNIQFIPEYKISEKRSFSIDIAIPKYKIAIEINGNQHYEKNGNLKEYYKNREIFIESLNWKVHQIHYSICFDDYSISKTIDNILSNNPEIFDFDYEQYLINKLNTKKEKRKMKNICECGKEKYYYANFCRKCCSANSRKVERPPLDILIKEVKDNGYTKTGKKYGVSDNTIRKWIKSVERESNP